MKKTYCVLLAALCTTCSAGRLSVIPHPKNGTETVSFYFYERWYNNWYNSRRQLFNLVRRDLAGKQRYTLYLRLISPTETRYEINSVIFHIDRVESVINSNRFKYYIMRKWPVETTEEAVLPVSDHLIQMLCSAKSVTITITGERKQKVFEFSAEHLELLAQFCKQAGN